MLHEHNPPLCKCCRTEPCKINPQTGEYGKKCVKCSKADAKRTLERYYRKKETTMTPHAQLAYSLLEAERKLNDDMVAELKALKSAVKAASNDFEMLKSTREELSAANKLARQLENDNVDLISKVQELEERLHKMKEKYEPASGLEIVRVVPQTDEPPVVGSTGEMGSAV